MDYSPLQELTHPSERDHALYSVPGQTTISDAPLLENGKLYSPGHAKFLPDEASSIQFSHLRPALTTRLRTQWDIHMVPSDLEFRYADLSGDVFRVPDDWTITQLLEEYRPEWRIRQYNYLESSLLVPGTGQPFILRLQCHQSSSRNHPTLTIST